MSRNDPDGGRFDPVYTHSLREAMVALAAWAVCLVWTLAVCGTRGYVQDDEPVPLTLGMPSWVFWGVVVPWVAATLFTLWFALFWMSHDELDSAADASAGDAATDNETGGAAPRGASR